MSDTETRVEPEGVMHDNHHISTGLESEGVMQRLLCEEKIEEPPKVDETPQTDAPKKAPKRKPAAKRAAPYDGKGKCQGSKGKGKKPKLDVDHPNVTLGKDGEVVERTEVVAGGSSGSVGVGGTQYSYNNLEELLDSLDPAMTHFCPIHKDTLMEVLHSKKEHVKDKFLRCNVQGCPCFCKMDMHEEYYSNVTRQGHEWFTLERITQMKCACGYDPTLIMSNSKDNPDVTTDITFGLSIEQWSEVGIMCGPTILRTLAEQLEMSEDVLGKPKQRVLEELLGLKPVGGTVKQKRVPLLSSVPLTQVPTNFGTSNFGGLTSGQQYTKKAFEDIIARVEQEAAGQPEWLKKINRKKKKSTKAAKPKPKAKRKYTKKPKNLDLRTMLKQDPKDLRNMLKKGKLGRKRKRCTGVFLKGNPSVIAVLNKLPALRTKVRDLLPSTEDDKDSFYLTLPSNGYLSKLEFPDNSNNNWRIRLPQTIKLEGQWEVGLASISYPAESILKEYLDELEDTDVLMRTVRTINKSDGDWYKTQVIRYENIKDIEMVSVHDLLVALFEYEKLQFMRQLDADDKPTRTLSDGSHARYQWELIRDTDSLTVDTSVLYDGITASNANDYITVSLQENLMRRFGFVVDETLPDGSGSTFTVVKPGPNLSISFRDPAKGWNDDISKRKSDGYYYGIRKMTWSQFTGNDYLGLEFRTDLKWTFSNLRAQSYKRGTEERDLYVYSSMCEPKTVGSDTTDLFKHVNYRPTLKGGGFYEPGIIESYRGNGSFEEKKMSFHLTLPSNGYSRAEFPSNTNNSWKIRLPQPVTLEGQWEVGLASISYPSDSQLKEYLQGLGDYDLLMKTSRMVHKSGGGHVIFTQTVRYLEIKHKQSDILSVKDLLEAMFDEEYLLFLIQLTSKDKPTRTLSDGSYGNYQWEVIKGTDSLTVDTSVLYSGISKSDANSNVCVMMQETLMRKFGFLVDELVTFRDGTNDNLVLKPGPNLSISFRDPAKGWSGDRDVREKYHWFYGLRKITDTNVFPGGGIEFRTDLKWTFHNLKQQSHTRGDEPRSLYVYSSLCEPQIMGSDTTDLLRHVEYKPTLKGEPVKRKTGPEVTKAFTVILKRARKQGHTTPIRLQTDKGKEFYNSSFKALLKKEGIHHFSTQGDAKGSVIERWNRTFKTKLYRYFTASNSYKFLDVIQSILSQYNHTYHRSIGRAPVKVDDSNVKDVWYKLYDKHLPKADKKTKPPRPKFKIGDYVRLSKVARNFRKGYMQGWTEELFIVSRYVPSFQMIMYKVKELDGTPIQGAFYARDLQKVDVDLVGDSFRVEKVLKRTKDKIVPPTDYTTQGVRWVKISPTTASTTPMQFDIEKQADYIDLDRSFFEWDCRFKTTGDANIASNTSESNDGTMTAFANNMPHCMIKQFLAKCNGTLMTEQIDMYHHKAYIMTLLGYSSEDLDTILNATNGLFRGEIDVPVTYTARNVKGPAADGSGAHNDYKALSENHKAAIQAQKKDTRDLWSAGKRQILIMKPYDPLFYQGRWVVPNTSFQFQFWLNAATLWTNTVGNDAVRDPTADDVKVTFHMCLVKTNPGVFVGMAKKLETNLALYPLVRSEIRQYPLDNGATYKQILNPFSNRVPQRYIIAIVKQTAFNGDADEDMYAYSPSGVEHIKQIVNGEEYPYETLELNTDNGRKDKRGYYRFLEASGCLDRGSPNMIRFADWGYGKNATLFMFSNVPSGKHDRPVLLPKPTAHIDLYIKCAAQTSAKTIIIMAEYESVVKINSAKSITFMNV
ncbi:putative uncharacterized transposon-derived protein F54H12.3 [Stylophora pistillata]|uniref:Uncharacterized transposon-derived protein F54H12.3 n=1 Tax=Stylophora pistillata TaxID=50429 RepID=A0A2B4SA04_STYPI|nr:putative uncharacterized transposon-derived protein F54H12.3 [Stylophora pistillata]